jgi:HEAT repeat protein
VSDRLRSDFFEARVASAVETARRQMREGRGEELMRAVLRELAAESTWKRQEALERLAALDGYDSLLPPLREALADAADPERRNAARSALTALASPGAADPDPAIRFLASLAESDPDPDVRVLAVAALGEAAHPRGRALLERRLGDPDPNVSAAAADSLGMLGDPRAVPALIEAAGAEPFWTRSAAVVALGKLQDARAIPALAAAVSEPWLSAAAAEALGEIGDPAGLDPLRRAVDAGDGDARRAALRAAACILGRHSEVTPPDWLREALRGQEAELAAELEDRADPEPARLLGLAGTPRAVEALLDQFATPGREEVGAVGLALLPPRAAAAAILGRLASSEGDQRTLLLASLPALHDPEDVRRIAALLSDPDAETRAAAAEALGRSDHAAVLEVLPGLLAQPEARVGAARVYAHLGGDACGPLMGLLEDAEPRVRAAVAEGLAGCGDAYLPQIRAALRRETDAQTRQALALALGRIGGEEAASVLISELGAEDPSLRFAVVRALGESRADSAFAALLDALLDPLPEIQAAAMHALGELGDPRAEVPLSRRMGDPDRDLRRTAVLALNRLPLPGAVARLRDALSDPDREIRLTAIRTLLRLDWRDALPQLEAIADSDADPLVRRTAASAAANLGGRPGGKPG